MPLPECSRRDWRLLLSTSHPDDEEEGSENAEYRRADLQNGRVGVEFVEFAIYTNPSAQQGRGYDQENDDEDGDDDIEFVFGKLRDGHEDGGDRVDDEGHDDKSLCPPISHRVRYGSEETGLVAHQDVAQRQRFPEAGHG